MLDSSVVVGHLIVDGRNEVRHFLVLVVVVHSWVVHDGIVAAKNVETKSGWRAVPVVQGAGEEPR